MSQQTPTKTQSKTDMHIGPYKSQEPFLWDDKRYTGFVAGVGSGKTHIGVARVVKNVRDWNPGEMGAIVAPASRMIKDTILPLMREMDLIGEGGAWDYESSYAEEPGIHTGDGGRILILSADNSRTIERLKGLNLAWWWIDERAEVPERAQRILEQRLRVGTYRNGFITTTPKGKDSVYDFFVGDEDAEKRTYDRATLYETENKRALVGVPTDANPFVPDDYKAAMERDMPDQIRAQEVQGQFVEIGSGVLTRDMLHAAPSDVLESSELSFHVGVDLGVESDARKAQDNDTDYWAVAIIAHHRRHGEAFVVDVKRKRGLSMSQGVGWLREAVSGVPSPSINIESVHAQEYFLQAAKEAGLPVHGVGQSMHKEDRLIQLSVPFENGDIKLVNFETPPDDGLDDRWQQFSQEWIAFPDGTHDDMLDAVELALRNVSLGGTFGGEGVDLYGGDE